MVSHNLGTNHSHCFGLSWIDLWGNMQKKFIARKMKIFPSIAIKIMIAEIVDISVISELMFTFPGIIDDPGSFSGKDISPSPQRGPEP